MLSVCSRDKDTFSWLLHVLPQSMWRDEHDAFQRMPTLPAEALHDERLFIDDRHLPLHVHARAVKSGRDGLPGYVEWNDATPQEAVRASRRVAALYLTLSNYLHKGLNRAPLEPEFPTVRAYLDASRLKRLESLHRAMRHAANEEPPEPNPKPQPKTVQDLRAKLHTKLRSARQQRQSGKVV